MSGGRQDYRRYLAAGARLDPHDSRLTTHDSRLTTRDPRPHSRARTPSRYSEGRAARSGASRRGRGRGSGRGKLRWRLPPASPSGTVRDAANIEPHSQARLIAAPRSSQRRLQTCSAAVAAGPGAQACEACEACSRSRSRKRRGVERPRRKLESGALGTCEGAFLMSPSVAAVPAARYPPSSSRALRKVGTERKGKSCSFWCPKYPRSKVRRSVSMYRICKSVDQCNPP